ncbi:bifunctional riboflavin kinase/FAD synthetase [Caminibacter pacificus]|jgi:riboflavin kinase/FMN adenylyltransferase
MHKIAIGGFDGVHIAHKELINRADKVVIIEKGSSLTPGFDRLEYINKPFDFLFLDDIKHLSPYEFIEYLKKLNAKEIIVGEDFRFGHNRSGDISLLKEHFKVEVIKEIKIQGTGVHAKTIRELIRKGEISKANDFLGRFYKIKGTKIKGQGLGKKELVATINIELFKPYTQPKPGVYATKTNGFDSVTFLGIRSTDNNFSIETHILDIEVDFSGLIEIEFVEFLRENRKFESLSALKEAIKQDIQNCKSVLNSRKNSYAK